MIDDLVSRLEDHGIALFKEAKAEIIRLRAAATPEPCPYCSDGKRTGLPGNACENCMNTGLKYPERAATPAVGGELQDIADEIEQSDGIALMLTGCSKQLGIRRTAMVIAALRAQPALMGEPDLTHYEADAESVLAVSPLRGREIDQADYKLGWWLAGALEDPNVCAEMKDVVNKWFEAHQPNLVMSASSAAPPEQPATKLTDNDLADLMKLAGDDRVSCEALGIRLRALWTSNR